MTTNTVKHTPADELIAEIQEEFRSVREDLERWSMVRDADPDLLDACDFALTILEALGNGSGDAANSCRAAISKATGSPAPQEKGGE